MEAVFMFIVKFGDRGMAKKCAAGYTRSGICNIVVGEMGGSFEDGHFVVV